MQRYSPIYLLWVGFWLTGLGLAAGAGPPQTFALVVGVSNYRPYPETPTLPSLDYAESDARKIAQALQDPKQGRVKTLRLLLEGDATKTAIQAELRDLARRVGPEDTLIFYYSGHGRPNSQGQASVMPYDAKMTDEETWLTLESVQALIQSALGGRGRYLMMVDACFSGQSLPGTRSFAIPGSKAIPKAHLPQPNWRGAFLASSAADQLSWEDADLGGGVFTAYLLEALSGKADTNGDGYVLTDEAYAYVARRVEAFTLAKGSPQNPKFYGAGGYALGFNPVVAARSRLAGLKLDGYLSGEQFDALAQWVDSPRQPEDLRLYLEGHLTAGQLVNLVQAGAIPRVPASDKADPRLLKVAALRQSGKIRLEQFWALSQTIQKGEASWSLSRYLRGKLSEAVFLQRLRAGIFSGIPR